MILSKIAERRPESIRCPWASMVSLAAMAPFYSPGLRTRRYILVALHLLVRRTFRSAYVMSAYD